MPIGRARGRTSTSFRSSGTRISPPSGRRWKCRFRPMVERLLIALILVAGTAGAVEDPTPELNAERDALLDKIARGEDWEKSVKRYAELVKQRDAVVATSAAAKAKDDSEKATQRADAEARRNWRDAYHK